MMKAGERERVRHGQWIGSVDRSPTCSAYSRAFMKRESACSFQQGLYTSTISGKAMFQMLGVFAEFERSGSMRVSRMREPMGPS
jgi:hypothetical protein